MGAVRRMGLAAVTAVLVALAGCSRGPAPDRTDNTLPWPSTLTTTGNSPPGPSDTPSPLPGSSPRPADAASRLLDAWLAGDRTAAAQVALPAVVTILFAVNPKTQTWFFGGCSSDTECDFNAAHQVAKLLMAPDTDTGGYQVIAVEFGGAG